MTTRTVSVVLQAEIGQYVSGMTKAALATKGVGETAETSATKAGKGFDLAGRGAQLFGLAAAAALVGVVTKSMEFEKAMSGVQAATQASASVMGELRDAAIKAGADTQYSATEAANAITEMAKAGVSAKDIMGGGLKGALSLAAAGQIDVAEAAGIAATAMTQFSLNGSQLPHVADLLAAGAGKAMGSVDDLGQALNQAGLLASSTGISIEETTGTLAAFASAGLIGSDAGTSFKTMLQQLQAPSQQSAALMQQLGINAYDAQGNFVGLAGLAQQLKDHLGGLTQAQRDNALATIFGTDAARAATVLYREGADGINNWTKKVNDAGYAQKQAAELTDNLTGDLERLGGSFDTLLISIGQGLQGPLRGLTQMLGGLVDGAGSVVKAFGDLPGPVLAGVSALGGMALLNGPLGGVLTTLRGFGGTLGSSLGGTFSAFGEAMGYAKANGDGLFTVLKSVGGYAAGGLKSAFGGLISLFGGPWGLAIAAVAASYELMVGASKKAEVATIDITQAQRDFADALRQSNGVIDENVRRQAAKSAQDAGILDLAQKAGVSLSLVTDGLTGNRDAYQQVTNKLHDYALSQLIATGYMTAHTGAEREQIEAQKAHAQGLINTADAFDHLSGTVGETASKQKQLADATKGTADATKAASQQTVADAQAAQKAIEDWINSMAQIGTAFVDPVSIYQGLLQTAAQATADATKDSKDSWQDYADSAKVSLDQFAQRLQQQITDQENWRKNLVLVAQGAGYDVAAQLEQMGVQGAGLVAQFANASHGEMQRLGGLMRQDMANGSTGAAQELDQGMKVMAAISSQGAAATANGISTQLGIGINDVARIAAQYGVTLATGLEPILRGLGKPPIVVPGFVTRPGLIGRNADGGLITGPGSGRSDDILSWLSNGEFVMNAAATARHRPLLEAINSAPQYADGGFAGPGSVPHPSSTAPYGALVASPSDGTMGKEYDSATSWLRDFGGFVNYTPSAGVAQWAPLVLRVLSLLGQSPSLLNGVLSLIAHESGGNPNAINLTDSNARAGHPSQGLMQTIPGTFAAYAGPYRGLGITNPLANIYAGLNYGMSRYGSIAGIPGIASLARGGSYRPYAEGGVIGEPVVGVGLRSGDTYSFAERGPEVVLPHGREMSGASGGSAPAINVAAPDLTGMRIVGTLDLGGGLEARIDGRIAGALSTIRQRVG